jgi:hypothetical protein
MRVAKLWIGFGLLAFVCSSALLVAYALFDRPFWHYLALGLALTGAIAGLFGIAWTLRWQNDKLNRLMARPAQPSLENGIELVTREDLSELIRIVDSRIVGLIETLQDDSSAQS